MGGAPVREVLQTIFRPSSLSFSFMSCASGSYTRATSERAAVASTNPSLSRVFSASRPRASDSSTSAT